MSARPRIVPQLDWLAPPQATGVAAWDALRQRAWARFQALGLPSPRLDAWKYADTYPLTQSALRLPDGQVAPMDSAQVALEGVEAVHLVLVDGVFHAGLSQLDALPEGVTVRPLGEALAAGATGLGEQLDLDGDDAGMRALAVALANTGLWLEVAPGAEVTTPVALVHLVTEPGLAPHWHHVVRLGEGARLILVERYHGLGAHWHNAVLEAQVAAGAHLEHLRLYEGDAQAFHTHEVWVQVAGEGAYGSYAATVGARLARAFTACSLEAPGARAALFGLYGGAGRHQADHTTLTHHRAPHTESVQRFKGVLDRGARGAYTGRVVVHPRAQKIDAQQYNANLLLSREAEADARPQLEIYADDVKCSHGATVGELDQAALFYLRARGIDEASARAMLTRAFLEDVLTAFPLPGVAQWVRTRLGVTA